MRRMTDSIEHQLGFVAQHSARRHPLGL